MKKVIVLLAFVTLIANPVKMQCAFGEQESLDFIRERDRLDFQDMIERDERMEAIMRDSAALESTSFIADNKKVLLILAGVVTIALALKYSSWVQGLVGLDTEDEIDEWREYIQD